MGLAEWIIDDTFLVSSVIQGVQNIFFNSIKVMLLYVENNLVIKVYL